jgi:hypothetical protein
MTIANAGHLSPYRDGRELELAADLPLGVIPTCITSRPHSISTRATGSSSCPMEWSKPPTPKASSSALSAHSRSATSPRATLPRPPNASAKRRHHRGFPLLRRQQNQIPHPRSSPRHLTGLRFHDRAQHYPYRTTGARSAPVSSSLSRSALSTRRLRTSLAAIRINAVNVTTSKAIALNPCNCSICPSTSSPTSW